MEKTILKNHKKVSTYQRFSKTLFILLCILNTTELSSQTVDFTLNTTGSCVPAAIDLTDKSTGASTWLWNFGNSNTATNPNVSVNYVQPGAYTVSLTINGNPNLISKKIINVYPKPNPTIPVLVQGCEPYTGSIIADATPVTITPFSINGTAIGGITGGKPLTYTWNFSGALPTITQNSPILTMTNVPAGSYDLLLTVTDENGCSGSIYKAGAILISPKPTADFSINKANKCGTGNVIFSATAGVIGGSIANYAWDINNDGTIESTQKDYTYNFTTAGTYNIALSVSSDLQCSSTKVIKQVTFNANNAIDFTFSGSCMGQALNFTDKSSASGIQWAWDFDNDGIIDNNTQNPSFSYSTAGLKTIKLKVTYSDGCEKELTKTITINGATPSFTYSTALACPPTYTIEFTSSSTAAIGSNITAYAWDFDNNGTTDDTNSNPSHDFNAVGTFPVRLSITTDKGCSYSLVSSVTIDSTVVDLKVDTASGCAPLLTTFTPIYKNLMDPIVAYNWNFGDGQSSTLVNPSHNYTLAGEYDVTLSVTTSKGCIAQKKKLKMVVIGSPPAITNITYSQASKCQKSPVVFLANVNNKIDQLIWDFGDNSTFIQTLKPATKDTTALISHQYLTPGIQTIKVKAYSNGCESLADFILGGIQINEPTASFKASSNIECKIPTANITFKNNSISADANTIWDWNFGDGTPNASTKSPSHIYNKAGDFKVMLTVTNTLTGCDAKDSTMIYVTTVNPKFSANNIQPCVLDSVVFTNLIKANSSANYKAASYSWDFGDPNSGPSNLSVDSIAKHRFSSPGKYSIKLKVTETRACTDSVLMVDYIDVKGPIVHFTNNQKQICSGTIVSFKDSTTKTLTDNANPALNSFLWNFGDGSTSTLNNPTHTFNGVGNYTVKLEVTDNNGCTNEKSITNSVIVPAVISGFSTTRDSYCTDNSSLINFTNTAVGTITSYDWDMDGDGNFEIINGASTQTRTFPTKGIYLIQQRVTSDLGCQNTFSKKITIVDGTAGIVLPDKNLGCAPAQAILQASDSASIVSSYLWDFGDSKTSTLRNPTHDYLKPGKYTITLTEVLTGGCSKSTSISVEVGGAVGTFSYTTVPSCTPYTVTLNAENLFGVGTLVWDFGDGSTTTEKLGKGISSKSITHTYNSSGSKLPILILKDSTCGNSVSLFDLTKRINTNEPPIANFTAASTAGQTCEKFNLQFTDASTIIDTRYPIMSWDWDFGDGSQHSALQNPMHRYDLPGTYSVKLTISNNFIAGGCNSTKSSTIIVNPLPVVSITNDLQEIYTNTSSSAMTLSSTLSGSTFAWTRTLPAGIVSDQAISASGIANGGNIPGELFTNKSITPITVNYKIIPTGPAPTFCVGDSLIASLVVDPIPSVSITKTASKPSMNNDGSYSWKYTITIINNINQKLDSIRVMDNLDDVFKTSNCDYKVTSITASGNLTANGLFNGSSNIATLIEGLSLGALQRDSIIVEVRVDTHGQKDTLTVFNQAQLSCKSTMKGFTILSDANARTVQYEKTQTNIPKVELFIPDAFSPNHDGINEQFIIVHAETMRVNLEVFNRWGVSVYKSVDYKNDWDGKGTGVLMGQDLPTGTYYINYKMTKTSTNEVISSGVKYITLKKE